MAEGRSDGPRSRRYPTRSAAAWNRGRRRTTRPSPSSSCASIRPDRAGSPVASWSAANKVCLRSPATDQPPSWRPGPGAASRSLWRRVGLPRSPGRGTGSSPPHRAEPGPARGAFRCDLPTARPLLRQCSSPDSVMMPPAAGRRPPSKRSLQARRRSGTESVTGG